MADTNSEPGTNTNEAEKGGQSSGNMESLRNLILIIGITILMVMAVILVAFLISGIARVAAPTTNTTASTESGSSNTTAGTSDTILGSLGGGVADSKPVNNASQTQAPEKAPTTPPVVPTTGTAVPTAEVTPPAAPVIIAPPVSSTPEVIPANTTPGAETGSTYTFTAGSGDSVSWLARRAMYAYLGDRGASLSVGQRLYFEVNLTQSSNPAPLNVGESRTFTAATMDQIMFNVTHLSSGEMSSWTAQAVTSGYI